MLLCKQRKVQQKRKEIILKFLRNIVNTKKNTRFTS